MDKSNLYIVLFFSVVFCTDVLSKKHSRHSAVNEGKIVGGYNTTIQQIPYQAYLLLQKGEDYYQCGGSIISKRYVLTAAHCLAGITRIYVRIGSTDSDSGGTMYTTSTYTRHPLYNSASSDYDVGVINLMKDMNLDGVNAKAVKLTQEGQKIPPGSTILVTGWGATAENADTTRQLMAVKVPSVSNEECKKSYSTLTDRMFCAGVPEGGKDSCQGDSGGPAVLDANSVQVGIVSFGYGCARPGYPGAYTNVSSVRRWIRLTTRV